MKNAHVAVRQPSIFKDVPWEMFFSMANEVRVFTDDNPELIVYGGDPIQIILTVDPSIFTHEEHLALVNARSRKAIVEILLKYTDQYKQEDIATVFVDRYFIEEIEFRK